MSKLVCPACKIPNFYVKNNEGDQVLVYVNDDYTIVPVKQDVSLIGYDLSEVYCLGCSWHGKPKKCVKY